MVKEKETEQSGETCEKCGGEIKVITIGDESYDKCIDCGHIQNQ